jgi:hypothetical protein
MARRGFSLAETILVMFLFALVLYVAGQTSAQYYLVLRDSGRKDISLEAARMGLDRVACDLRQAIGVSGATRGGGPVPVVRLTQIDPLDPLRLNPGGNPPETPPFPLDQTIQVTYQGLGDRLIRTARGDQTVLVYGIQGFSVEWVGPRRFHIELSVTEMTAVRTFVLETQAPCL